MRTRFVNYKRNKGDKLGINWSWKTTTLDFIALDSKMDYLKQTGRLSIKGYDLAYILGKVGLPDWKLHNWKNGLYSMEYNDCLNILLELNLIMIKNDLDFEYDNKNKEESK